MCGVVGFYSNKEKISSDKIQNALLMLNHRGPDGSGVWVSDTGCVALGHARLSIIGLDNGTQPISTNDGQIHAVVNGEFYGFQDIRDDLISKGRIFKTDTDSEILIHLYAVYGLDCLQYLRGEFSFILWDGKENRMIAGRDRFGVKPLCYSIQNNGVYVASEAKALFTMGVNPQWDHDSYYHAMSLHYLPQDKTIFKGVDQLKPGHVLIADDTGTRVKKYWDMDYPRIDDTSTDDIDVAIQKCHDLFVESVKTRLVSDVPVCFHLSGGLDSSAVLGVASHLSDKPLDAFTVSFDHDGYDEIELARETAQHLNANLHVVNVGQRDLMDALPDAVYHAETPAINGHLAAKYLLNKSIHAKGFRVALTGEGADEVFAGYPHLRHDLWTMDDAKTKMLMRSNAVSAGTMMPEGAEIPTHAVENALGYIPSFLRAKSGYGYRMHNLLSKSFINDFKNRDCYHELMETVDINEQLTGRDVVHQSMYLWSKLSLANYILRAIGDGVEMAHSIEGRLPFLDHKLFEYIRNLPVDYKIRDGVEKYIFRQAMKPYITDTVYKRQKHPFMAPPVAKFSNPHLDGMVGDIINSASFKTIPFFDVTKVQDQFNHRHDMTPSEQVAFEPVLMSVISTALLHERYGL